MRKYPLTVELLNVIDIIKQYLEWDVEFTDDDVEINTLQQQVDICESVLKHKAYSEMERILFNNLRTKYYEYIENLWQPV